MNIAIKSAILKNTESLLFVTKDKIELARLKGLGFKCISYLPFIKGYHRDYYYVNQNCRKEFEEYNYLAYFSKVIYY